MPFQKQFEHVNVTVMDYMPQVKEDDLVGNQLALRSKFVVVTVQDSHPYSRPTQHRFVLSPPEAQLSDELSKLDATFLHLSGGDEVTENITVGHRSLLHCDIITLTLWSCRLRLRYDLSLVTQHQLVS